MEILNLNEETIKDVMKAFKEFYGETENSEKEESCQAKNKCCGKCDKECDKEANEKDNASLKNTLDSISEKFTEFCKSFLFDEDKDETAKKEASPDSKKNEEDKTVKKESKKEPVIYRTVTENIWEDGTQVAHKEDTFENGKLIKNTQWDNRNDTEKASLDKSVEDEKIKEAMLQAEKEKIKRENSINEMKNKLDEMKNKYYSLYVDKEKIDNQIANLVDEYDNALFQYKKITRGY